MTNYFDIIILVIQNSTSPIPLFVKLFWILHLRDCSEESSPGTSVYCQFNVNQRSIYFTV